VCVLTYSNIMVNVVRFGVWGAELLRPEFPRNIATNYPAAQVLRRVETRYVCEAP